MTILATPATPTTQLHWDPMTRSFVGEISSTNGFGRVYDDACDEGLTLVGKSGVEIPFVVDRTLVRDGELVGWELIVVPGSTELVRHGHPIGRIRLTLFND